LKKGEVQVNEKERDHDLGALRREIATLVSEKCVDPATQRPHPVGLVEKGMNESGFSVKPGKSAKSQVSECIRLLQEKSTLPIQRARMRIRVAIPKDQADAVKAKIVEGAEKVEDEKTGEEWEAASSLRGVLGFDAHLVTGPPHRPRAISDHQRSAFEGVQGWGQVGDADVLCNGGQLNV
jgi:ribosome maturation protein Sdo1